jgi:ParB family chromosome partitioning protein
MEEKKVDETCIFEIDPVQIKVADDRPRQRKDLGEIAKMVESIKTFGQLQPIVISRNNELIAGGRRLAACMLGGFKARVCYKDTIDPLLMQEMELEENVQRKALTPAEECVAIKTLVELKRKIYGTPVQGQEGGYTLDKAAQTIGKTRGSVIEAIQIAELLEQFPDLSECKTKSEIKSAAKGLQRTVDNLSALSKYEMAITKTNEFVLVNRDARDHMKGVPENSIDLLFTDPPFGINIDKMAMSIGGHTGGDLTTTGIKYDDSPEYAISLYAALAANSIRFCKDTAHAIIFCGPSHFWTIKNMFNEVGWICSERPVIWIKQGSGQNNNPDAWFSSSYEMMLFARRENSKLVLFGKPDWIQCNIVTPTERNHQAEKPVALIKELISRVCMPGQYMYDPFMGGGSIIQSAVEMKLFAMGCELAIESYAAAVARMAKLKGEK